MGTHSQTNGHAGMHTPPGPLVSEVQVEGGLQLVSLPLTAWSPSIGPALPREDPPPRSLRVCARASGGEGWVRSGSAGPPSSSPPQPGSQRLSPQSRPGQSCGGSMSGLPFPGHVLGSQLCTDCPRVCLACGCWRRPFPSFLSPSPQPSPQPNPGPEGHCQGREMDLLLSAQVGDVRPALASYPSDPSTPSPVCGDALEARRPWNYILNAAAPTHGLNPITPGNKSSRLG